MYLATEVAIHHVAHRAKRAVAAAVVLAAFASVVRAWDPATRARLSRRLPSAVSQVKSAANTMCKVTVLSAFHTISDVRGL
jgi:uncharacterized protein YcbK (DUF882 family)